MARKNLSDLRGFLGRLAMATALAASALLARELSAAAAQSTQPARPNVIIVLSDDQGYGDFSCNGNPVLKTPALDRLARESVRLTDFHVAPMCTPTRGQLLSGMDACRSGATSVCAGRSFLKRGIPTMADAFTAGGYKTALFGKWHLGDSYPNLPQYRGFGETVHHLGWGITSMADYWCNDLFNGHFLHDGKLQEYPGYCTDVWFNLSIDWIKERKERNEPFFLYLPTNAPHGPHWAPDEYKPPYAGPKLPTGFFAMIANLDENMGRLDRVLRETGLAENTIVIFFHDNGGTAGTQLFNAGMRGKKTTYYEGGHRSFCLLRAPGEMFGKARAVDDLTQVQDLLPTLIDVCGLPMPPKARFDGTSLRGLLAGSAPLAERTLVVQYGQVPKKFESAVMWKKWRLVHGTELYDLARDPGQLRDVAAEHADVVARLRKHYETWWAGIEPGLDDFSPLSIGARQENPVQLSAADWANVYCDNMRNLRTGKNANGVWHLQVEADGEYEIALRRWPERANAAIAGPVPEFQAVDGVLPAGRALPIASMRLKVGDQFDETRPVATGDKEIKFRLPLKAGQHLPMQSFCYDAAGKELCGAYFAYVTHLP